MTTFLTSDQHFFHHNIIRYCQRPFKDVEEMNREIIARHNSIVKENDTVYHLGDFAYRNKNSKMLYELLKQLNGKKHIILGNHEAAHSCHKKHQKYIQKYLAYGFTSIQEQATIKIGGRDVLLCHLPYLNENDEDQRFKQWRPIDKGQFLLHGHVHECYKVRGRMINVGVDVWDFYPVSEHQIQEIIADITEGEQE